MMKQGYTIEIQINSQNQIKALNRYKKRLLFQVILLFLFILIIIAERVFYEMMIDAEQKNISAFQIQTNLATESSGATSPSNILNSFYAFWAYLSQFNIQFLFVTHAFLTMYVAFDSAITTKVMMTTFGLIQCFSFLQLLYGGARPYWTAANIFSSNCLESYNHPDLGSALLIFIPSYAYYCWRQKFKDLVHSYQNKCNTFSIIAIAVAIVLIQFLNFVTGNVFLINIGLSVLFSLLFFTIFTFLNVKIDKSLKGLSNKQQSLSYQTKWLFFIIFSFLFVEMTYSNCKEFQDIQWIKNHITCKRYTSQSLEFASYDKIIGPWFSFRQCAVCFAWIGVILAVPICKFSMKSQLWSKGTIKQKIINIIICNLMLAPSWVFQLLLKDESWIREIGVNALIIDGIHYFLLYLWLFGFMPPLVLSRLHTVQQLDYDETASKACVE